MPEFGFSLGRSDGYPSRYPDQYTPAHVDVLTAGLITAFLILAIALFAIVPAYNPFIRRILFCRIVCSLFIGGVIVVCNYGHHWEKGVVEMSTPYKPGLPDEIQGELGLHIALRGINITLKGHPVTHETKEKPEVHSKSPLSGEKIDYNEHFSWEWAQGRFGFGKYAGRISRDFRAAVLRGVPLPILQVAEYFTFDGEGIRFGRHYRHAGWYTHLIMWFAFGTWLISNILFCMTIRTAALFLFLTGCLQLAAVGVWTFVRNFIELQIPFQSYKGDGEVILKTSFGVDYYLVLANGIFCIFLAGLVTLLESIMPDEMCQYFGIDPLTIYDELLLTKAEVKEENRKLSILRGDIEMDPKPGSKQMDGTGEMDDQSNEVFLRRRSNMSQIVRNSIRHLKPRVPRRSKGIQRETGQGNSNDNRARQPLLRSEYGTESEDEAGPTNKESWPAPPSPSKFMPPAPPPKPRMQS